MKSKIKKPAFLAKKKTSSSPKKSTVAENLRPESRLAKAFNKASNKTTKIGAKEVSTPTPKRGFLGKRVNPFAPIIWVFKYIRDSYRELKKVDWLDRKSAWKLTGTVFLFSFLMAMLLFGLDSFFNWLFEIVFLN